MKLDTRNLDHLVMLQNAVKKNHSVCADTDQGFGVRITMAKDAPDFLDSWIAADEMFSVIGGDGKSVLSEYEYIVVSDKSISLT